MTGPAPTRPHLNQVDHWICYYGDDRDVLDVEGADMLVLDGDSIGMISDAAKGRRVVLAYLSVGEAETFRWYWDEVRGEDWVLARNPNWPGSHLVDPRSPEWRDLVVRRVAGRLIARGYDGFLLDTLDTVDALLADDPLRYEGSARAMAELVKALRREYPSAAIIINGGLSLLPELAPYVDGVMFEGVRSTYDFGQNTYRRRTAQEIEWIGERLARAEKAGLPVFALEYAAPEAEAQAKALAQEIRSLGYVPFVSEISLQTYPERVGPE